MINSRIIGNGSGTPPPGLYTASREKRSILKTEDRGSQGCDREEPIPFHRSSVLGQGAPVSESPRHPVSPSLWVPVLRNEIATN